MSTDRPNARSYVTNSNLLSAAALSISFSPSHVQAPTTRAAGHSFRALRANSPTIRVEYIPRVTRRRRALPTRIRRGDAARRAAVHHDDNTATGDHHRQFRTPRFAAVTRARAVCVSPHGERATRMHAHTHTHTNTPTATARERRREPTRTVRIGARARARARAR